jgi:hypothetical protein
LEPVWGYFFLDRDPGLSRYLPINCQIFSGGNQVLNHGILGLPCSWHLRGTNNTPVCWGSIDMRETGTNEFTDLGWQSKEIWHGTYVYHPLQKSCSEHLQTMFWIFDASCPVWLVWLCCTNQSHPLLNTNQKGKKHSDI